MNVVNQFGVDGNSGADGPVSLGDYIVVDPVIVFSSVILNRSDIGIANDKPSTAAIVIFPSANGNDVTIRGIVATGSFAFREDSVEYLLEFFTGDTALFVTRGFGVLRLLQDTFERISQKDQYQ